MLFLLFAVAAIGHATLWVALVNRLHGTAFHRKWRDALTGLMVVALASIPFALFAILFSGWEVSTLANAAAWSYVAACAIVAVAAVSHRLWTGRHSERRGALLSNHTTRHDLRKSGVGALAAPGIPALLCRLPGNQVFDIRVHEKQLVLPRLVAEHDGLRIAHLTDLHMSGRLTRAYFERVVEIVNENRPDMIALTGDLVERNACIDWIPETLGRLSAPGGVYYVLGNHDLRVDQQRLKAALQNAGLIHVGDRTIKLTLRNMPLVLAGNELPWLGPPSITPSDRTTASTRVLLAHSPDQFAWAQENDFDLMLAGHNHGGQVRLPIVGPVLVPSRHGVRYAHGVFRAENTVMHVSRGTSSLSPVRYNCPPEIAILELRPGEHA